MKRTGTIIGIFFLISNLHAQVTGFTDRQVWTDNVSSICYSEDFESFTEPVSFRINDDPADANGFTIHQSAGSTPQVGNIIAIESTNCNNTNGALIFVEGDGPIEVDLEFDEPICGFFADYYSANNTEILIETYVSSTETEGSHTFSSDPEAHGFIVNGEDSRILRILFRASSSDGNMSGESFCLDNIEIACDCDFPEPIPTLNQWGLILLSLILGIIGIVSMGQIIKKSLRPQNSTILD